MSWLVCVFVPFIVVDRQLAMYCNAPPYKVCTYNTEELFYDRKKQLSRQLISDGTVRRQKLIRRYIIPYLFTPSLFSFGALTDGRTDRENSSPLVP